MIEGEGCCWPEQEVVDAWLKDMGLVLPHAKVMILKSAVTEFRVEEQNRADALRAEVEALRAERDGLHMDHGRLQTKACSAVDAARAAEIALAAANEQVKRLRGALAHSSAAADFYDKVCAAGEEERTAAGVDHWNWLLQAAQRARSILKEDTPDEA